jgi:hypothetical protein
MVVLRPAERCAKLEWRGATGLCAGLVGAGDQVAGPVADSGAGASLSEAALLIGTRCTGHRGDCGRQAQSRDRDKNNVPHKNSPSTPGEMTGSSGGVFGPIKRER